MVCATRPARRHSARVAFCRFFVEGKTATRVTWTVVLEENTWHGVRTGLKAGKTTELSAMRTKLDRFALHHNQSMTAGCMHMRLSVTDKCKLAANQLIQKMKGFIGTAATNLNLKGGTGAIDRTINMESINTESRIPRSVITN